MKRPIKYSTYASAVTIIVLLVLAAATVFAIYNLSNKLLFGCTIFIVLVITNIALWYAPMSLSLADGVLSINRSMRIKDIPVADIASVRMCPPTMAARRICGSGGFMGYWGLFSEPDLGRYFAYYGRASDCFLVTLRDGRRYMLGCTDAPAMVAAIRSEMSNAE